MLANTYMNLLCVKNTSFIAFLKRCVVCTYFYYQLGYKMGEGVSIVEALSRCEDAECVLNLINGLGDDEVLSRVEEVRPFLEKAFSEIPCFDVLKLKVRYPNVARLWRTVYRDVFWEKCRRPPEAQLAIIEGVDIPKRLETLFRMHLSQIPNPSELDVLHLMQKYVDMIMDRYGDPLLIGLRDAALYGFVVRISDVISSVGLSVADVLETILEEGGLEPLLDTIVERCAGKYLEKYLKFIESNISACRRDDGSYDATCLVKLLDRVAERLYIDVGNENAIRYLVYHRTVRKPLASIPCTELSRTTRESRCFRKPALSAILMDMCRSEEEALDLNAVRKETAAKYIAYRWALETLRETEYRHSTEAIIAIIERNYIKGLAQIPVEHVSLATIEAYRDCFARLLKNYLPKPLLMQIDLEKILKEERVRKAEFEKLFGFLLRGEEPDVGKIIELLTYRTETMEMEELYLRLDALVKTLRQHLEMRSESSYDAKDLLLDHLERILLDNRFIDAIARSKLCRERSKPLPITSSKYPYLSEVKDRVIEILKSVLRDAFCGKKRVKLPSKRRRTEVGKVKVKEHRGKRRILVIAASLAIAIVLALVAIILFYP